MDVCPRFFYVVLSCVGRSLASEPEQAVAPNLEGR
jgi:hypothetical protein